VERQTPTLLVERLTGRLIDARAHMSPESTQRIEFLSEQFANNTLLCITVE
jgi:hypothetical protein